MFTSIFRRRAPLDVQQLLQRAHALQQQGGLVEAEAQLRKILDAHPDHFDALHLLGVIQSQQGRHDKAESSFARALRTEPASVAALQRRGLALMSLGRHQDALASFDAAIAIKPDCAPALRGRGNALLMLARPGEAIASFTNALAIEPDDLEALANLGQALLACNGLPEALAVFDRALVIRRDIPALLVGRANAMLRQNRHAEALAAYDEALTLEGENLEAVLNRGSALHLLGRSEEAIVEFDKALALAPDHAPAWYNRGLVLHALGRGDEAIAAYERALAIDPNRVNALHNLGIVFGDLRRFFEAATCYEQVLAIAPDYPHAAGNLAHAKAQVCDWSGRDQIIRRVDEGMRQAKHPCVPLVFLTLVDDSRAHMACARSHIADRHPPDPHSLWTGERYRHHRIRVAYLSADFRDHAVAYLVAGLIEQHDRERIELTGISFGDGAKTLMRARIEAACERFIDVRNKSDATTAAILRELEIDIAVDLTGHTGGARPGILACRPAPVQVNYLGYPGSMGANYYDYILADRFVIPEEKQAHYAEKVVYLPDTFQVNDAKRAIVGSSRSRDEAGLPPHGFVFCCLNNHYKITPTMFDSWMRLLRQLPGSVLWVLGDNPIVEANLSREATLRDVDPARLVFAPHMPYANYLAQYRLADLFLDTLPFNAGTTASDALWAGLPVLTCAGDAFAARMAGSLLHAVGLPELVTHSLDDYEALALRLANDAELLGQYRRRLADHREHSALFDTALFRKHLEAAYATMLDIRGRGELPRSFAVERQFR